MKTKIIKISAVVFSSMFAILPLLAFSATTGGIENPLAGFGSSGTPDIQTFIQNILSYVVKIGGVIAIFAFIYAGYLFVEAQGNPEKLKNAKTVLINTCIGVAVLLGAQLIASIVVGTIKSLQ